MQKPFTLRRAMPSDADAIAAVHRVSMRTAMPWLPDLHTEDATRAWVREVLLPQQEVWVAETDGQVVGMAALAAEMLQQLYIHPDYQGQGIGNALFRLATERYPAGFTFYAFQRNARARAFYEARGCVAVAFGDGSENEEGEPDVLYAWKP
jgi:ribosomal protein S18 acetylase RimI-like enzyme